MLQVVMGWEFSWWKQERHKSHVEDRQEEETV
jgi:hypothetical protein